MTLSKFVLMHFFPKESAYLFFRFSQSMSSLNFFRKKRKYFFRELQKFFCLLASKSVLQLRSNIIEHTLLYLLPNTWKSHLVVKSIGWTLERLNWLVVTCHWPKIDHDYSRGRSLSRLSLLFFFFPKKKRFYTFNFFSCFSDFIYLEI